jgi:hypothetical protein
MLRLLLYGAVFVAGVVVGVQLTETANSLLRLLGI